jgi:adenylylsulfate kinase-like enzyme
MSIDTDPRATDLVARARTAGGTTLWFTGLPSAGKSTIAHALADRLVADGVRVQVLDGDAVRPHLSAGLGFSRTDRDINVTRIGWVARLLASHGVVVLVPANRSATTTPTPACRSPRSSSPPPCRSPRVAT